MNNTAKAELDLTFHNHQANSPTLRHDSSLALGVAVLVSMVGLWAEISQLLLDKNFVSTIKVVRG